MIRRALPALLLAALAVPAAAQEATGGNVEIQSPSQLGVVATTPSRIASSRRELNRGRNEVRNLRLTPAMARGEAERALRRGGFQCTVVEAVVVGQTRMGPPLLEVDCAEGGGVVIADTSPMLASDCLDLSPDAGLAVREGPAVDACRLPANVASVEAERQSAARN